MKYLHSFIFNYLQQFRHTAEIHLTEYYGIEEFIPTWLESYTASVATNVQTKNIKGPLTRSFELRGRVSGNIKPLPGAELPTPQVPILLAIFP